MQPISLVQIGHFNNLDTDNFEELIWLAKMNNPAFEFEIVKDHGENVFKNPLMLSINRMLDTLYNYTIVKVDGVQDQLQRPLYIFCKRHEIVQTIEKIKALKLDDRSCICPIQFSAYFTKTPDELNSKEIIYFWWDIKNDFFWFCGNEKIQMIGKCLSKIKRSNLDNETLLNVFQKALFSYRFLFEK